MSTIGAAVGNIIATIMTTQTARKSGAARPMVGPMPDMSSAAACQRRSAQEAAATERRRARMILRWVCRGAAMTSLMAFGFSSALPDVKRAGDARRSFRHLERTLGLQRPAISLADGA